MDEAQQVGQALVAALRRDVGQELALRSMPQRLSGGFWASIWVVEFEHAPAPFTGRLVLRIMPDADAVEREVAVQSWLAEAGYPTPRVFASGHAEGLGEAYAVMQHAAGRSPLGGLKLGRAILGIRRILTDMPKLLAQTAADLHALDPQPLGEVFNETNSVAPSGLKDHAYVSFRAGSHASMRDRVRTLTGITITVPDRRSHTR